jgi:fatty-acyl-CoA synthase
MTVGGWAALTPVSFLHRSATLLGDRTAVVEGDIRLSYDQLASHVAKASSSLREAGIADGDRVAVLAPNAWEMLVAHFAVPAAGAILVALNYRLTARDLGRILEHSGTSLLVYDGEFADVADQLDVRRLPAAVLSPNKGHGAGLPPRPTDELALISLNYTSGTTGDPKGVEYLHRGAYLQALAMAHHMKMCPGSVYLWTLPMFHCNGWCFPWAVTAAGGTHVCLRKVEPERIWQLIHAEGVTHLCAAPTVLTALAEASSARRVEGPTVRIATGGAPPSPNLLARLSDLNFDVTHLYGLTETYGPAVVCDWQPQWDALAPAKRARLKARQGNVNILASELRIADAQGRTLPRDGQSMGEVLLRGNTVMRGYFHDPEATAAAMKDGWFRTGDLGVMHPDGYIELRDRAKDIIISGGENIPSIEVEQALCGHPDVVEASVVGAADDYWGEVPVAFVVPRDKSVSPDELIAFARTVLPGFKVPRRIFFEPLPKTSTGKVQKHVLRQRVAARVSA